MSNSVSVMLMDCVVSLTVEVTWICDMSSPFSRIKNIGDRQRNGNRKRCRTQIKN